MYIYLFALACCISFYITTLCELSMINLTLPRANIKLKSFNVLQQLKEGALSQTKVSSL